MKLKDYKKFMAR